MDPTDPKVESDPAVIPVGDNARRKKRGEVHRRASDLEAQGLSWWFEMDLPRIAAHLEPLGNQASTSLSARLRFLIGAVQFSPPERFEEYFAEFSGAGDPAGQFAAAGAGILAIWNSGAALDRYEGWRGRIEKLLENRKDVPPLAIAALLGFRGMMEMTGRNDLAQATATYEECLDWCERAQSVPLRVFQSAMLSYCYFWKGELARAEILLADTAPLRRRPDLPLLNGIYFDITRALLWALQGKNEAARDALREVTGHPAFPMLPPYISLLSHGHLLYALAQQGDAHEIEAVADTIRHAAIPGSNYFHHSYIHFCLAIACNLLGEPAKGLLHGRKAVEIGKKSCSEIAQRMPALVVGQSLSDLGDHDDAIRHLTAWIQRWRDLGYDYFVAAGLVEIAAILARRGEIDRARGLFDEASASLPRGEQVPHLLRPRDFIEDLRRRLFAGTSGAVSTRGGEGCPIHISTLGGLRIRIGSSQIYDRKWLGGRTKSLLKALIVFGGEKVSRELLADMLWPDSEADQAVNNLKVALSRLRRLGTEREATPLPWIVVRHQHVSLSRSLVYVDALVFREGLRAAVRDRDSDAIRAALDLYQGDFLERDASESWIVRHRESLREQYVQGVIALAEIGLGAGTSESSLPYLLQATERDVGNERLYVLLMDGYLRAGYPSKAIDVYKRAKAMLRREFGIDPGPVLQQRYHEALSKG